MSLTKLTIEIKDERFDRWLEAWRQDIKGRGFTELYKPEDIISYVIQSEIDSWAYAETKRIVDSSIREHEREKHKR